MSGKRTFSVYTAGIDESEKKVLRNIFKLSLYRTRSYALLETPTEGAADILIVDPQGENAAAVWQLFSARQPHVPAVVVSVAPPSPSQPYCIRRPFVASRLLAVLDQVSINEHRFAPELVIGADSTAPAATIPSQPVSKPAAVSRHTALVVDDSLPVRKQIELELKLLGVDADFADSGERAIELLDLKVYDIVFLDVVLPGVDGYRICKTIKKNPTLKRTPVVMLTSKSSPFDRVRGSFAGCDTYLTKPVAHEAFQDAVRKYLAVIK
jgi:twitching motility two-component system response regulator PilG